MLTFLQFNLYAYGEAITNLVRWKHVCTFVVVYKYIFMYIYIKWKPILF